MILIVILSFYHVEIADLFSLSVTYENKIYQTGMFWAAAIGSYGVVVSALGFALSPRMNDKEVRLLPILASIFALVVIFFYLLASSTEVPFRKNQRRLHPGETITI
jgi:hypothetical protein